MNSKIFIALILFLLFFGCIELSNEKINENEFPAQVFFVSRVIDGDTIKLAGGERIRLLGINAPERNEFYYEEAKQKLIELVQGKQIELIYGERKTDRYGRTLAFILIEGINVNLLLVRMGLASTYMLEGNIFKKELIEEEIFARKNEIGLWKKSESNLINCLNLIELNPVKEFIELNNSCNYAINLNGLIINDAGRNNYVFNEIELDFNESITLHSGKGIDLNNSFYWNQGNVWNNKGDKLFVRDEKGLLIIFYEY